MDETYELAYLDMAVQVDEQTQVFCIQNQKPTNTGTFLNFRS